VERAPLLSSFNPITHLLPSTALEGILYVYIEGASLFPIVNPPLLPDPNPHTGLVD
jgi:hypothetical protein